LVIPFLGPSTIRDGIGSAAGFAAQPTRYLIDDETTVYGLNALNAVQIRAGLLSAEQLISGDRYLFFRDAYLQRREYQIKDGEVQDDFLDDEWEE
jgi:phospholipid-binding lipoprotein MlaA